MKKIFTILCSMAMMLALPVSISANTVDTQDVTTNDTKEVELYATAQSTYTVRLPMRLNISNNNTELNIQALGNIASDEKILISFDDSACILKDSSSAQTKQDDISLTIAFKDNVDSFFFNKIKGSFTENDNVVINIAHGDIPAGDYEATLPITIALTDIN